MNRVLILLLFFSASLFAGSTRDDYIDIVLSKTQQKECGLDKLTMSEKTKLSHHFYDMAAHVLRNTKKKYEPIVKEYDEFKKLHNNKASAPIQPYTSPQAPIFRPNKRSIVSTSTDYYLSKNIDRGKYLKINNGALFEVSRFEYLTCSLWLPLTDLIIIESDSLHHARVGTLCASMPGKF